MRPMSRSSKNRNVVFWGWVVKTPWLGSSPSGLRVPAAVVGGDEKTGGEGPAAPLLSVRARRPDRTGNGSGWWIGVGSQTGTGHGVVRNQDRLEAGSRPAGEVEEAVGKVTGPKGTDGQTCQSMNKRRWWRGSLLGC
jgi:hypothetical protein